ncbi:MAG: hypothetical protein RUMPE_00598 [Eubacteriales bacterium SKADARSKE-1]|nr:hypothetical protein [Eubacteriales bacterium SKADARSKE-1]
MRETPSMLKTLKNKCNVTKLDVKKVSCQPFKQVPSTEKKTSNKDDFKKQTIENNAVKAPLNKIINKNINFDSSQIKKLHHQSLHDQYTICIDQFPTYSSMPTKCNKQAIYDAISCLHSRFISKASNFILNAKYINVYSSKELLEASNEFFKYLLNFGVCASIFCFDQTQKIFKINPSPDSISIFINTNHNKILLTNASGLSKEEPPTIINVTSCNDDDSFENSIVTLSINLYNPKIKGVSEKDKIKICLNCICLNILSKKVQNKKNNPY